MAEQYTGHYASNANYYSTTAASTQQYYAAAAGDQYSGSSVAENQYFATPEAGTSSVLQQATPPFFFQINRIEENPHINPRISVQGMWLPPRQLYGSRERLGGTTGKFYYFNGENVSELPSLPSDADEHKQASMYHHGDMLWMVPYDCTRKVVGNGSQSEVEPESDSDAEADDDSVEDITTHDWSLLFFMWRSNGRCQDVSACVFLGNEQRLSVQRPDQGWVQEILPTRHHAELSRQTTDIRYGGMIGELCIIIGLLALSTGYRDVDRVIRRALRSCRGDGGGWRGPGRRHLREDRRGVVVKIWSWPPYSTSDTLVQLEKGEYGNIFR